MTEEGLQYLLRACKDAAPNGKVQAAFAQGFNELRAEGASRNAQARWLAGRLYDGLASKNWPGELFAPVPQED